MHIIHFGMRIRASRGNVLSRVGTDLIAEVARPLSRGSSVPVRYDTGIPTMLHCHL